MAKRAKTAAPRSASTAARRTPPQRAAPRAAPATAAGHAFGGITVQTPSHKCSFHPQSPADAIRTLQRAAMQWTYVLRNRERWAALPVTVKNQAERARALLESLGLSDADLQRVAADRIAQVAIPFTSEADGWEARIFRGSSSSPAPRGKRATASRSR
jgi:hypothetical protein